MMKAWWPSLNDDDDDDDGYVKDASYLEGSKGYPAKGAVHIWNLAAFRALKNEA